MRRTKAEKPDLTEYGYRELWAMLGQPDRVVASYAEPMHWRQGDPRPALADIDPAVCQAMGRCALDRQVRGDGASFASAIGRLRFVHPVRCAWCEYPLGELLAACDWATWASRYVASEFAVWVGADGSTEARSTGRTGIYEQPEWAAFFALPAGDRRERVRLATDVGVVA